MTWGPSGHELAYLRILTPLRKFWNFVFVLLGGCLHCDLLVDNVHLEDSCSVVRKHPTVEEELGQSEVNHPVILSDDRVHSVVHQRVVLMRQGEKHPLQA